MNTAILETRSSMSLAGQGMLVVLDGGIPHLEQLRRGLLPGAEVLELRPGEGLAQITDYLATHGGFNSLHIVSHGKPGQLFLGDRVVDLATLQGNRLALESWRGAGGDRFEILLYGCDVGQGVAGSQFIAALAAFTGATVAASPTPTGHESLGGRWQLTTQTAPIQAAIAFTPQTQASYPAILAEFTAFNGDELIEKIKLANDTPGADKIRLTGTTFNLTKNVLVGQQLEIFGPTGLPLITDNLEIFWDGNANSRAKIERTGTSPFRIMAINEGVAVTLNNLEIVGGQAFGSNPYGDDGGGILNVGSNLTINNSIIRGNTANDDGGGILNIATAPNAVTGAVGNRAVLTMVGGEVRDNKALAVGGGLDDGGAGIDADGNARLNGLGVEVNLIDVTITGNTANLGSGGGIRIVDGGTISLDQVTITGNSSRFGSGIAVGDTNRPIQITRVTNSIIRDNTGGGKDIQSLFHSIQNNDPIIAQYPGLPPGGAGIVAPTLPSNENLLLGNDIPDPSSNIPGLPLNPVNPTVIVERLDGTKILDGATLNLTVVAGQGLPPFSFRIRNAGQNPMAIVEEPDSDNDTDFNFVFSTPPFANPLLGLGSPSNPNPNPGIERFDLNLIGNTAQAGTTFSTNIRLKVDNPDLNSTLVNGVSTDGIFDFALNVSVVAAPTNLTVEVDPISKMPLFTTGVGSGGRVKISVLNAPEANARSSIQNLNITYVSGGNLTEQLFSVLPVVGQPRGFGVALQSFLINNINNIDDINKVENNPFVGNETFKIALADSNITSQINVNAGGNGVHDVIFDTNRDGQFNNRDLILRVNQTTETIPLGVGTVQANGLQLIDLRSATGGRVASFTLYREATFNNTVGLYRIDDISGTVNGIAPGQAGYAQAAISNRISEVTLAVGNQQSTTVTSSLQGGALYAPFMVVNADIDAFLNSNPNNSGGGINAFFAFQAANPDAQNHIVLLGSNTFGFEDLFGGGDRDFNDMIFQVQIT
ncbi:DUF4347 domain-containing protein [Spirulina sp. CCNP1310]|uniref:DUF4347 domain-containing protein n=1 Tax=Spirulina sp. CCNP1310 TaxID=3110249 RepID=UPI002B1ECD88|nr:DUF4347 domain-containing protein [Spirulina sp. CCNP1310]MEA5419333.1 DUF4347 domain-containing protein [Spirulina sp. CCNP1310]